MKYFSIALFTLLFTTQSFSCSFLQEAFCTTINTETPENVVMRGYFSQVIDNGLVFTRLETLKGSEDRSEVTVWDNLPFDCNGIIQRFASHLGNLDEEIIISVAVLDTFIFTGEIAGDYRTPDGIWWETHSLKVEGDNVIGNIYNFGQIDFNQMIPYEDFIQNIIVNGECSLTATSNSNSGTIKSYPTLVNDILKLDCGQDSEQCTFELIDFMGRRRLSSKIKPYYNLGHFEKGMYVVIIRKKDRILFTQKIVKI